MAGAEKQLFELATRLDPERHDVTVCTIKPAGDGPLLDLLFERGIRVCSLDLGRKWQLWKLWRLRGRLRQQRPDILQSFLYFDNLAARIFGRLCQVPIVICGQRNARHEPSVRLKLDKLTQSLCHKIVANTQAGKDKLVSQQGVAPSKIKVIYNGVEPAARRLDVRALITAPKSATFIGFVGTLSKQKNVSVLLAAVARLHQDVHLVLLGDGPERRALEVQARLLGIERRVHVLGHIDSAREYIGSLDILALPSQREGMPNVLMEAMVQGAVCVTTAVGGVPELIEDTKTGFLAEPGSVDSFTDALERALDLQGREREVMLQRASRQMMESFSFPVMVDAFNDLYASLR